MFLRRKPNRTGSVSVQVIDKSSGRYSVVKSFGIGRTELELLRLEARARQFISEKTGLTATLFPDDDDLLAEGFVSTLSNSDLQVIGPELIFGRLYDYIGYGAIKQELFRHLVVTRLFSPGSKLRAIDYLHRYQGVVYDKSKIYRFLDALCLPKEAKEPVKKEAEDPVEDIKSQAEQISFSHTRKVLKGKISAVFYDMTTLYFEAADEDELRKTGFSKDGKHQCPQVFLGLLVAGGGNPIGYELFEGNIRESQTFIGVLEAMRQKFGLGKPTVIADSGLLSVKNMAALEKSGYKYILGARPKNEAQAIKDKILALSLPFGAVATIIKPDKRRLILSKTGARAKKDAASRKRGIERLAKRIKSGKLTKASINNRGYNKYLKIEGSATVGIDRAKFEEDAAWDGIKGYLTNSRVSEKKVLENYSNLWYIERAFRMNKTDLQIRPIYHRLRNRIEGHICICFSAYTIMLEVERMLRANKSSITLNRVRELAKTMYQITYRLPKSCREIATTLKMDDEQEAIVNMVERWVKK
jgi:hypothetical protein